MAARTSKRPPAWQLAVSAVMIAYIGAQCFAGVKFLHGSSYPVVGSAMFNGPPSPESTNFMVPRVFGTTLTGASVEMDQRTFNLEPFEWRAWVLLNLENASQDHAYAAGADLAAAYGQLGGETLRALELWRIPALTDDFDRGELIRTVDL